MRINHPDFKIFCVQQAKLQACLLWPGDAGHAERQLHGVLAIVVLGTPAEAPTLVAMLPQDRCQTTEKTPYQVCTKVT